MTSAKLIATCVVLLVSWNTLPAWGQGQCGIIPHQLQSRIQKLGCSIQSEWTPLMNEAYMYGARLVS